MIRYIIQNPLCFIGLSLMSICYGIQCFKNPYWFTIPIFFIITFIITAAVVIASICFFVKIGWVPQNL